MRRSDLLLPDVVKALQRHANRAYPNEAIGLITRDGYQPMRNVASEPDKFSEIPLRDLTDRMASGDLLAIAHSHPGGPHCPSEQDMVSQMHMQVPFVIVSTNGGGCLPPIAWGDQLEPEPLLGRGFVHGITDCYELIRDHRWLEHGERLPQFPRNWGWWDHGQALYLDGIKPAGYRPLQPGESPEVGDVFLAQVRSKTPNHAGVLVEPGVMIHHVTGRQPWDPERLSRRETVTRWREHIVMWVRRDAA